MGGEQSTEAVDDVTEWTSSGKITANTKHLYNICTLLDQRRRRWADVVQMIYKCVVFDVMCQDLYIYIKLLDVPRS